MLTVGVQRGTCQPYKHMGKSVQMQIFVPKETDLSDARVPLIPDTVEKLVQLGVNVVVESDMGLSSGHSDKAYEKAGAAVTPDRQGSLASADIVMRLHKPPIEEIGVLRKGCIHISFLDPFNEPALIDEMVARGISAISMELIPRTALSQKMDALSSQANLGGYVAVIVGAAQLNMAIPMMMTPAGTIKPARVFVIGAGLAGLQAIATAKRLGARVEAFDTRPAVEEQVKSLGAKFVNVDLGETGQTKGGYAKALTAEQQAKQREAMAKVCAQSDLVVTTAKVFGRPAPRIITGEMVAAMRPGSVIVDLAVGTGGNVEGAEADKEVDVNGVKIVGLSNAAGRIAVHASQMYSSNLGNLFEAYWDKEDNVFNLDLDDEIIRGCLVTHNGTIQNEMVKNARNK